MRAPRARFDALSLSLSLARECAGSGSADVYERGRRHRASRAVLDHLDMLQADKQVLLAGVKRNALELRQRELEFHVERYTNLATQASVVAGFSFESLVELEVPEGTHPLLSSCYFVFGSAAMALSLYVLCVASFACVFGHRLALQGPHGSLEKAVHIMIDHRLHIFATAGVSQMRCQFVKCVVFAVQYALFARSHVFRLWR